jgi:hypothetical protein
MDAQVGAAADHDHARPGGQPGQRVVDEEMAAALEVEGTEIYPDRSSATVRRPVRGGSHRP